MTYAVDTKEAKKLVKMGFSLSNKIEKHVYRNTILNTLVELMYQDKEVYNKVRKMIEEKLDKEENGI